MIPPRVSLIICTHNPREDYLAATLAALREQTLPVEEWELLLVDNLSSTPVADRFDLSWHPRARHLREPQLGLSHARLCGIHAAQSDLLVFADDDNLLAANYLHTALDLAERWPQLGVWGAHISGRFEGEAPAWVREYAHHLAVRSCERAVWASYVDDRNLPYGAGMCLRATVAAHWQTRSKKDPLSTRLGRIGKAMGAADDSDICHAAQDLGLGIGRFPELSLTHLIPANRMEPAYFIRLAHGNARSALLLALARKAAAPYRTTPFWPIVKYLKSLLHGFGMKGRILRAQARGELDALREIRHAPSA
jgi:glycosyltransferase involved in cell wall biosynthesis